MEMTITVTSRKTTECFENNYYNNSKKISQQYKNDHQNSFKKTI